MFEQERTYVRELPEGCIQCDRCGEMVEENEITYLDGTNVCRDCLTDFCNGYVDELGEAYIAEHRKEFCMDWILPSYSEEDLVRAIFADYEKNKQLETRNCAAMERNTSRKMSRNSACSPAIGLIL